MSRLVVVSGINRCVLMDVIVPKLGHAEVWKGNMKSVQQRETVQMAPAKDVHALLERTSSNTVWREELGMHLLEAGTGELRNGEMSVTIVPRRFAGHSSWELYRRK